MTHDTIVALAALGVAGQVLAAALPLIGAVAAAGFRAPLRAVRLFLWGYELWAAFVVSAIATGGTIITLLAALRGEHRIARYLLPLPLVGAGVSIYHLLIENTV